MNTNKKNVKNMKEVPIFFAVDDNYIPVLSVAIKSMLDNASKSYKYVIKILNTGIKEENKEKFNVFKAENVDIDFVDVSQHMIALADKLHTRDYYSKSTYFRLFIPKMFPQYNKALYLDADIVVTGDISKFYNSFIGTSLLGAVPDEVVQVTPIFVDYAEKALGLPVNKYFNAGILIMNLKQLRNFNFEEKFVDLLGKYTFRVAQDQDYLNVICKNRVWYLNETWDKMPLQHGCCDVKKLNIIHYNMGWKPWHADGVLFGEVFWKYAKETNFYDEILHIKANYTEEDLKKDAEVGANLLQLAINEVNNPNNYYNLFVKNADGENDSAFEGEFTVQPANS